MYHPLNVVEDYANGITNTILSNAITECRDDGYQLLVDAISLRVLGTPPENLKEFMYIKSSPQKSPVRLTATQKLLLSPQVKGLETLGLVPFNFSGKHMHLDAKTFELLYGYSMPTEGKELIQKGEYVVPLKQRPSLILPEPCGEIPGFAIIGGPRPESQAEIDLTYMVANNLQIPHKASGDLENAPEYIVKGPTGKYAPIKVICAIDHLHLDEQIFPQLQNREKVLIALREPSGVLSVYPNVQVKRTPKGVPEVHVNRCDTILQILENMSKPEAIVMKYHLK